MSDNKLKRDNSSAILKNRGYNILSKINEGSFAKVYHSEFTTPTNITTKLAVKIIEPKRRQKSLTKKFIPRELSILSQIEHPHIIHIHSILQIGLKIYIFMRFAEQGDLLEYMVKNGTVHENQARVWIRQIALAIQYLHVLNIAHRDLKCENILVTMNYNVKLSDFGFARYTVDSKDVPIASETYCGTLLYAAPEILHNQPYNPKISDLWSIGVILYVMVNKSLPFDGKNPRLLYENQLQKKYKFRSKVKDLLSPEVKQLVADLLEPDPMKRYRIEGILNSDWIAMDKRLTVLSSQELAALSKAYDYRHLTPTDDDLIENFSQRNIKLDKSAAVNDSQVVELDEIKPYDENQIPRQSEGVYVDRILLFADRPSLNVPTENTSKA